MTMPKPISFANLPTKIEKLERLSNDLGKNIYIKRDDHTGIEISGNKIRKLEFAVGEAVANDCDLLITCGGIQSNHARATAAVAAKLGLGAYLVLRGDEDIDAEGNYFLDKMLGAKIKLVSPEEYKDNRTEIMDDLKSKLEEKGHRPYIIPEGASNGVGSLGYYRAMEEILQQEKEIGIKFDAIVVAVGSGGTYAGLYYGNYINKNPASIYGFNITANKEHFQKTVEVLLDEISNYTEEKISVKRQDIDIIDGYVGLGYALSQPEEIECIHHLAKLEGLILDPVYTGKAMFGLIEEIKKASFKDHENILFIHTGGIFGWNSDQRGFVK